MRSGGDVAVSSTRTTPSPTPGPDEADVVADPSVNGVPVSGVARGAASRAGRNVVALITFELLGKVATLAFTVVVARQLGAQAFGSFSYALAFGIILATFIAWGFDSEMVRRRLDDPREIGLVLGQALLLRTVHAVPIVLVGGVLGALARPSAAAAQVLVLVLLATVIDSYADCGRVAATAWAIPGQAGFVLVLQRLSACVLTVVALALGGHLVAVAAVYLASSVVGLVGLGLVLRRAGIRPHLRGITRADLQAMWRTTFQMGVDTVFGVVLFRVDAVMLGAIGGDAELAEYTVGYRLMETVLFVTWSVSRALLPVLVRAEAGRARVKVGESALAVAGAVLVPYGVVMLLEGDDVLRLLFGAEYAQTSAASLQWLAFAPVAFAVHYYCGYLLFLHGHKQAMMLTTGFALVVNVALNVVLIPAFGAEGAAAATTASYVAAAMLRIMLLRRLAALFRVERALALCVGAAVPMAASLLLIDPPVIAEAVIGSGVYLVAYLLLAWRFGPEQIAVLRSMVRRR